jgi:hypothetical protein
MRRDILLTVTLFPVLLPPVPVLPAPLLLPVFPLATEFPPPLSFGAGCEAVGKLMFTVGLETDAGV